MYVHLYMYYYKLAYLYSYYTYNILYMYNIVRTTEAERGFQIPVGLP